MLEIIPILYTYSIGYIASAVETPSIVYAEYFYEKDLPGIDYLGLNLRIHSTHHQSCILAICKHCLLLCNIYGIHMCSSHWHYCRYVDMYCSTDIRQCLKWHRNSKFVRWITKHPYWRSESETGQRLYISSCNESKTLLIEKICSDAWWEPYSTVVWFCALPRWLNYGFIPYLA